MLMMSKYLAATVVVLCVVVSCVESGFLLNRLRGRSADSDSDDDQPGGVFGAFDSIAGDLGIRNVFRDMQIRVLGASEQILDSTKDMFENIEEATHNLREDKDKRSSDLKKALLYLKTEARRRREDLEDEIEVEKEKAQEALEAKEKSKRSTPKSETESSKQKRSTPSIVKKLKNKRKTIKNKKQAEQKPVKNEKELEREKRSLDKPDVSPVQLQTSAEESKIPDVQSPNAAIKEQVQMSASTDSPINDNEPAYTDIPMVQSLGNGFGRHTGR